MHCRDDLQGIGFAAQSPSRPYHVALADLYVREHWVDTVCKLNSIPFDGTGERIQREGTWCIYEFAVQLDAIQFGDRFEGRWLRGEEFMYPDRPKGLPQLREPPDMNRFGRRPGGR
ncbi:hypothetical protein Nham_1990 [Nitrobacter hamburgensis X14]|uniref:Uncharacterized protein n=1 Tax=Nitrobacter hamburgensis (strain DSM 10229 / NCIMB 13809 / X14) TaxID=323097 RepID=Q1QLV8_NITHX|nr:hypothetical protein Nham_1990 [Nitrobacter hamburgensis X14]